MVNRATKRLMAKQQRAEQKASASGASRMQAAAEGRTPDLRKPLEKKRTPPRQFIKEVRSELKKVAWPSRKEVVTYTVVVLVSVIFVTALVFGLDFGIEKAVFEVFSR